MRKLLLVLVALAFIAGLASAQEIAVIVKTGNSSFWQNVQKGAFAAQKELKAQSPKFTVTFLGAQSESAIAEEINIVQSAIDRGVKAIVLAPSDVTALVPAVKQAKDAGIPVIIIDSLLSGDKSNYVSFMATDNKAAGEACAKELIARVKAATGSDTGNGKCSITAFGWKTSFPVRAGSGRALATNSKKPAVVIHRRNLNSISTRSLMIQLPIIVGDRQRPPSPGHRPPSLRPSPFRFRCELPKEGDTAAKPREVLEDQFDEMALKCPTGLGHR